MTNIQISNFCELFGFNKDGFPKSRLPIKIGSTIFPTEHVFHPDSRIEGFCIPNHIDDLAIVYFDNEKNLVLHMFVPEGTCKKIFINCQPEKKLYRYGELKYLEDAYEKGVFLIRSALEYIKKEYDEARRDNELIHSKTSSSQTVTIIQANNKPITPTSNVIFNTILPVGCYILCFSYDYDLDLYEKFTNSDSCLIINDTVAFTERLHTAFSEQVPGYSGIDARVSYSNHMSCHGPLFSKPRDFIYQREYRFAWIPTHPKQKINLLHIINEDIETLREVIPDPLKINLGSLEDISNIVIKK